MWEEAFKWLNEHYHGLAILIVGAGIGIYLCNRYFHWRNRVVHVEMECHKIDNELSPQLGLINSSLLNLTGLFNNLVIYLQAKDGKMDASLFISKSPIELTELAKDILIESGGKEFVDAHEKELIKEMNSQNINTALDAQTFAPIIISKFSNTNYFKNIKDYIFKNPFYRTRKNEGEEVSIPLNMAVITNILGIYLRNIYLEKRPELNPNKAILA